MDRITNLREIAFVSLESIEASEWKSGQIRKLSKTLEQLKNNAYHTLPRRNGLLHRQRTNSAVLPTPD